MNASDVGFTHVALPVSDLERSIAFYERFASLQVVHRRGQPSTEKSCVAWLSDLRSEFVLVLVETKQVGHPLGPFAHLGVAVASDAELDHLCATARSEGWLREGPTESGPPVGRWAFLDDPDGHTLELSFGQQVRWAVTHSVLAAPTGR
jgi:catechol 2,3-dioxygenase-like lactoylglutathione lyase family enzyme